MLDPVKYPQYYVEHPDQLSEKFKNQYEIDKGDVCMVIFTIVVVLIAFIIR